MTHVEMGRDKISYNENTKTVTATYPVFCDGVFEMEAVETYDNIDDFEKWIKQNY